MLKKVSRRFLSSTKLLSALDSQVYILLLAILIGILGGYGAVLFRYLIKGLQYLFYQNTGDILLFADTIPAFMLILMPCLGGLIVGLIIAKDVASTGVVTVKPSDNIQVALHKMSSKGISQIPVVGDGDETLLIGTLRQKDVIAAYEKEIVRREIRTK